MTKCGPFCNYTKVIWRLTLVLPNPSLAAHVLPLSGSTFSELLSLSHTAWWHQAWRDVRAHRGTCWVASPPYMLLPTSAVHGFGSLACMLTSLAPESSTHVFVNIVGGDAARFLRAARSLYLATTHQRVSFIFHISNRYFLYILATKQTISLWHYMHQ